MVRETASVTAPLLHQYIGCGCLTTYLSFCTDAHPIEEFGGMVLSGTSFNLSWSAPNIEADFITGYTLMCVSLLAEVSSPEPLMIDSPVIFAIVTGLHPGVTYNCTITTITPGGSSQPLSVSLTTLETGISL